MANGRKTPPALTVGGSLEKVLFNKGYKISMEHLPSETIVEFKALVTTFEDQYSSEWNTETVFGRMDPIRGFRGTQRIITLGWDVVAADLDEAKWNMSQCSTLLAMLYPSYGGITTEETLPGADSRQDQSAGLNVLSSTPNQAPNNAALIKSAPLFRLRFANLIQSAQAGFAPGANLDDGLIGSVDGLTYAPDLEQGFFDPIVGGEGGLLYPQTIKLTFGFYVAHDHPLGWGSDGRFRQRNFPLSKLPGEE